MCLATTIGQFQLPHSLVVPACQAQHDIFGQFAQVEGGIGKREEVIGVLIDGPCFTHRHIVEVSREDREGQCTCLQFVPQVYHVMPGFPRKFAHYCSPHKKMPARPPPGWRQEMGARVELDHPPQGGGKLAPLLTTRWSPCPRGAGGTGTQGGGKLRPY